MAYKGLDMGSPVSSSTASCMVNDGYDFLCRYYAPAGSWKLLSKSEAKNISNAGMDVVAVYEGPNGDKPGHFTRANGLSDGLTAISRALEVGQPFNSTIYFAVDFDATSSNISSIKEYFRGVSDAMTESRHQNGGDYVKGVYGSYYVVSQLDGYAGTNRIWQTYAWSGGKEYAYNNIYQYSNNHTVCGHEVDYDSSPGAWGGFKV